MAENITGDATEQVPDAAEAQTSAKLCVAFGALIHILGMVLVIAGWIMTGQQQGNAFFGVALAMVVIGTTLSMLAGAVLAIGVIRLTVVAPMLLLHIKSSEQNRVMTDTIKIVSERMLMSETAKRIAYRSEDLDLLRAAIKEDIRTQRFDAALALLTEMGTTFGYQEEAEMLREEITQARAVELESKVNTAFESFEAFLAQAEWDKAASDANKIKRLYPDHLKTRDLGKRILEAKEQHKRDLERQFLQAAERDEVEKAEALLKELDKYLSPQEAEPFRETARAVFGKKKQNLGVQFKLAISDHEYAQAIRVGQQIIREFPNSKMADEVRGHLDKLRELATKEKAAQSST